MKFNIRTHIAGKVYDLTQENMCIMIAEIEELQQEREELRIEVQLLRAGLIKTPDTLHKIATSVTKMGFGP